MSHRLLDCLCAQYKLSGWGRKVVRLRVPGRDQDRRGREGIMEIEMREERFLSFRVAARKANLISRA